MALVMFKGKSGSGGRKILPAVTINITKGDMRFNSTIAKQIPKGLTFCELYIDKDAQQILVKLLLESPGEHCHIFHHRIAGKHKTAEGTMSCKNFLRWAGMNDGSTICCPAIYNETNRSVTIKLKQATDSQRTKKGDIGER